MGALPETTTKEPTQVDVEKNYVCDGITKGHCPEVLLPKPGQKFITFDNAGAVKYPDITKGIKCTKAKRVHYIKSPSYLKNGGADHNMANAITLTGCDEKCHYLWHAQYECVDSA